MFSKEQGAVLAPRGHKLKKQGVCQINKRLIPLTNPVNSSFIVSEVGKIPLQFAFSRKKYVG